MLFRSIGGVVIVAIAITLSLASGSTPAHGATFVVLNTNNSGPGSFSDAIIQANGSPGNDTITFDPAVFPPGAPAAIQPASQLPYVDAAEGVTIDGTGAGVVLDGQFAGDSAYGLSFEPFDGGLQNITIRSIYVLNFGGNNIDIASESVDNVLIDNVVASGSHDGMGIAIFSNTALSDVTVTNVAARDNHATGVDLYAITTATNIVFDKITAERNLGAGVSLGSSGSADAVTFSEVTALQSKSTGINVFTAGNLTNVSVSNSHVSENGDGIGFTALGDMSSDIAVRGNESAGNSAAGITLVGGGALSNIAITNNLVDANGTGVELFSAPGSLSNSLVSGNTIMHNASVTYHGIGVFIGGPPGATPNLVTNNVIFDNLVGVQVLAGHITISRNVTYGNQSLGIDLLEPGQFPTGVTDNDAGDGDSGANDLLNFPENFAFPGSGFAGTACANCLVEVFESDDDPLGHGEGERYLRSTFADGSGAFTFEVCELPAGAKITATATDDIGNTSEFSENFTLPVDTPPCLPDNGDLDCDGDEDGRDALIAVIHDSDAAQLEREPDCPELGSGLAQAASVSGPEIFGDVNCDGSVDAGDAIPVLQFAAGVEIDPPLPVGCSPIGEPLPD